MLFRSWLAGASWSEAALRSPRHVACAEEDEECDSEAEADDVLLELDYATLVRTVNGCARLLNALCNLPRAYRGEPMHAALDGALRRARCTASVAPEFAVTNAHDLFGYGPDGLRPPSYLAGTKSHRAWHVPAAAKMSSAGGVQSEDALEQQYRYRGVHDAFDADFVARHDQYASLDNVRCVWESWSRFQTRLDHAPAAASRNREDELQHAEMTHLLDALTDFGGIGVLGHLPPSDDVRWQRVLSFLYTSGSDSFPTHASLIAANQAAVAQDILSLGGFRKVARALGMVQRRRAKQSDAERWERVRKYLKETKCERFPTIDELVACDQRSLVWDIRSPGGAKAVASALGLPLRRPRRSRGEADTSDVRLERVRRFLVENAASQFPTRRELLESDERRLVYDIAALGGSALVARALGVPTARRCGTRGSAL